jgi:tetratricopeptide (TPR) repeat protein
MFLKIASPALLAALLITASALAAQEMSPDELFQDGINNLAAKKFAEAEASFRKLRAAEPNNVRGVVGVGQTLMAQAKFAEALQYVTAEVARDPTSAKLNLVVGDLAAQAGQMEIAAVRFQRVLDLLRTDPNVSRFFVKRTSKRPPESVKDPYAAAMDNFTGNDTTPAGPAGVYLRLADAFLRMGDGPRGVAALENARHLLPTNPTILMDLAMLYEMAREGTRALAVYLDLLKVQPDNVAALNNGAYLLAESNGNMDDALRFAMHAAKLQPLAPEIIDTLGWVHFKRKELADALATFAKLLQIEPGKQTYRDHMKATLALLPDTSPLMLELRQVINEPPGEDSNRTLAELLAKMTAQQN